MSHRATTTVEQARCIILLVVGRRAHEAEVLTKTGFARDPRWDQREKLSDGLLNGYDFHQDELREAVTTLEDDGLVIEKKFILSLTPEGTAAYESLVKERAAKVRLEIFREAGRTGRSRSHFFDWDKRVGCDAPDLRTRDIAVEEMLDDGLIDGRFDCSLTAKGVLAYEELCATVFNFVARRSFVRNRLLHWAYEHQGTQEVTMSRWLTVGRERFYGDPVSIMEIQEAGNYLCSQEMLTMKGESTTLRPWLHKLEVTVRGIDCVERGTTVADFVNPQPKDNMTIYNNYLPNAQGIIIGKQQDFTQNNTKGVDPAKFIQLAGYIGQISGTLGLDELQRIELERVAEELHEQASSGTPEVGRLRALGQALKETLMATATTIAAQVGVQMAEDALASLVR
ncbi:hypothetical protein OHT68_48605 (plasmid) [Streptomyces canus]|uniref:hypothetical protein n=1 Tax=Streptomyces canus TaxID=58343 RepID=UPI002E2E0AC5|nr:hypothetical protein [Streptomyces canus]